VLELFVCGDVMLGRGIDQIMADPCDPTLHESYVKDARDYVALAEERFGPIPRAVSPRYPWGDALELLDAARPDVRVINLETSITRSDEFESDKGIHYRLSPENASCLAAAGIDVCALANNHVLDWGPPSLRDTLVTLDRLGIAHAGAGNDLREALQPAVIDRGDRGRAVVFSVGCTDAGVPPWWAARPDRPGVVLVTALDDDDVRFLRRAIEPWRQPGSIVVVSIHWGANWGFDIPPEHVRFAHRLVDEAGVDIVHGHSSHHVKAIEVFHGRLILYGCGDLLTDYEGIRGYEEYRGDLGVLYLPTVAISGALHDLVLIPVRMRRLQITRADPEDEAWIATALARSGRPFGTSVVADGHHLRLIW
jgi:poly-gamma-glutamate synthesis protein (capsule biosynthesis protein)